MISFVIRYGLPIAAFAGISYYFIFNSSRKSELEARFDKQSSRKQEDKTASENFRSIIIDGYNPAIKKK